MYLHLPSIIKQDVPLNKQPIWAQGCCITPLNTTYEGDMDFKYKNVDKKETQNIYDIKWNLGKKRWLKTPRPLMRIMVHAPPLPLPPHKPGKPAPAPPPPPGACAWGAGAEVRETQRRA
jgi:hypothetical protein